MNRRLCPLDRDRPFPTPSSPARAPWWVVVLFWLAMLGAFALAVGVTG